MGSPGLAEIESFVMNRYPRCILGTCPIPWDEQYRFAKDLFRRQVRYLLEHGTRHLYIFGTAGEGYAVSDGQFDTITRAFAEEMAAGGAEPMVGLISLSLPTIIERIEIVGSQGHIDGVYDKLFCKIVDRRFPLRLLPPYTYAKDESFMEFVSCIRQQYPNWLES